jgi:hypothetical protein
MVMELVNRTITTHEVTNVTTTICTSVKGGDNMDILLILVCGGAVLLSVAGITIIWYRNRVTSKTYTIDTSKIDNKMMNQRVDLTGRVDGAKMEVQGSCSRGSKVDAPVDGWYAYSYHQNDKTLCGKCHMTFVEMGGEGFKISGTSTDPDGLTNIEEGICNFVVKAYWKESYVSGDIGLQVLNKGVFNFTTGTFEGERWATSGASGIIHSCLLQEERDDTTVTASTASS